MRTFADVRLDGADRLRSLLDEDDSFVLACNHVCWWDPLLLVQLERFLDADGYCLMDAENLKQFPFFAKLGALAIDRSSTKAAYRDLKRATSVFRKSRGILSIFPQGEHYPAHLPLELKGGVVHLAKANEKKIVPFAIRYDFGEGPRATVRCSVGEAISPEGSKGDEALEALRCSFVGELKRIDDAIVEKRSFGVSLLGLADRMEEKQRRSLGAKLLSGSKGEAS